MPPGTIKTGMTFGRTEPPTPLQKKPRPLAWTFTAKKMLQKK